MCFCSIGIIASGPITGYLFQEFEQSNALQWFTGGTTVFGGGLLLFVRAWARPKFWSVY